jgi:hypothetical protein
MSASAPAVSAPSAVALDNASSPPAGRLAVLTALAAAATAVPLPILPDKLLSRVRGAIAHDVLARHGLSLTTDAREVFAEPDFDPRAAAMLRKGAEFAVRRLVGRLGPVALLGSAARAVEVFALGHLLDRYAAKVRETGAVRVQPDEARRVRVLVNRALLRAISPSLRPTSQTNPAGVEDLRDEFTRWSDTLILTGASLPSYVVRRLEAAFDEIVAEGDAR